MPIASRNFWTVGTIVMACLMGLTSGAVAHHFIQFVIESEEGPTTPVSITKSGEVFFFSLGLCAGVMVSLVLSALFLKLLPVRFRWTIRVTTELVLGLVVGVMTVPAFFLSCLTLPRDVVELLFVYPD